MYIYIYIYIYIEFTISNIYIYISYIYIVNTYRDLKPEVYEVYGNGRHACIGYGLL